MNVSHASSRVGGGGILVVTLQHAHYNNHAVIKPTLNPANVDRKDFRPSHQAMQQPDYTQDWGGTWPS